MKYQGVRMDFTPKELKYFLFAKKICPHCGGEMRRSKESRPRYGWEFHETRDPVFSNNALVKYYSYYYTCQDCGQKYSLSQLAGESE